MLSYRLLATINVCVGLSTLPSVYRPLRSVGTPIETTEKARTWLAVSEACPYPGGRHGSSCSVMHSLWPEHEADTHSTQRRKRGHQNKTWEYPSAHVYQLPSISLRFPTTTTTKCPKHEPGEKFQTQTNSSQSP